jgi:hypothetical protein
MISSPSYNRGARTKPTDLAALLQVAIRLHQGRRFPVEAWQVA